MSSRHVAEPEVAEVIGRYSVSIGRVGRTLAFLGTLAVVAGALAMTEPTWTRPEVLRAVCGLAGVGALGAGAVLLTLVRARAKLRRIGVPEPR